MFIDIFLTLLVALVALVVLPFVPNQKTGIGPRLVAAARKPGAIGTMTEFEEQDWHRTCAPCYGNAGLWGSHLLHLGCSKGGSTNYKDFTTYTEVDLDLCLTNLNAEINNRDDNDKAQYGHHKNLNYSKSCDCVLNWSFVNGSMTCHCNRFDAEHSASFWVMSFKDVLYNDNGLAGCYFGKKKVPGKKLDKCPTKDFTKPEDW